MISQHTGYSSITSDLSPRTRARAAAAKHRTAPPRESSRCLTTQSHTSHRVIQHTRAFYEKLQTDPLLSVKDYMRWPIAPVRSTHHWTLDKARYYDKCVPSHEMSCVASPSHDEETGRSAGRLESVCPAPLSFSKRASAPPLRPRRRPPQLWPWACAGLGRPLASARVGASASCRWESQRPLRDQPAHRRVFQG